MNTVLRRTLTLLPPALLVGFVVFFSWILYWNGDAVLYQFVYQDETVYFTWEPIRNMEALWRSITRHYMEVNGRFVCHFIVMLVVSFVPQWLFAILSGVILALLLWMVCKLAEVGIDSWRGVLSVTLMGWLAFDNLTDPAFYINYIWMGTLVVAWIWMFLRHPNPKGWLLVPVGLFSIIAGQAHECFALPVGLALIVYLVSARFRVSRFDWVAGTCFCVGGLSTFIAPGLFVRIDNTIDIGFFPLPRYDLFLLSILPILFGWTLCRYRPRLKTIFADESNRFWLWVVIGNLILSLVTFGRFGTRAFTIGSVGIIVLVIRILPRHNLNLFWTAFFILISIWLVHVRTHFTFGMREKYMATRELYRSERPDTVWLPDRLFMVESKGCENLEEHTMRRLWKEENDTTYPKDHIFKALPASLRDIPRDFEGNICREIAPNVYLLVQSRKNPARFISHKRFFPGFLNLKLLPDREIVFGESRDEFDLYIDSTEDWIAGYYTNEYIYCVDFDIEMFPPSTQ